MPLIVDVQRKKIAIGEKFTVAINNQPYYRAKSSIWKLFPKIELMPLQGDQVFMSVEMGWGFLKPNVTFSIGTEQYKLETISWWKRRFAVTVGKDRFEIVGHRGRKVSIFQNDRQIAWFTTQSVTFFAGENYHCIANATAPIEWLIAFIFFWDENFNRQNKGAINFKFGAMVQSQSFDKDWQPN